MRTVHPTKAFTWNHLEVDALVTILGVDQMGKFHGVELLGYNSVEIDESGGHPGNSSIRGLERSLRRINAYM